MADVDQDRVQRASGLMPAEPRSSTAADGFVPQQFTNNRDPAYYSKITGKLRLRPLTAAELRENGRYNGQYAYTSWQNAKADGYQGNYVDFIRSNNMAGGSQESRPQETRTRPEASRDSTQQQGPVTRDQIIALLNHMASTSAIEGEEGMVYAAKALLESRGFIVTAPGDQPRTDIPPAGPTNYPGGRAVPLGPAAGSDALVEQARTAAAAESPRGGAPAAAMSDPSAAIETRPGINGTSLHRSEMTGQMIPDAYIQQAPGWAQANLAYANKLLGSGATDEGFIRRLETSGSSWERSFAQWIKERQAAIARTPVPGKAENLVHPDTDFPNVVVPGNEEARAILGEQALNNPDLETTEAIGPEGQEAAGRRITESIATDPGNPFTNGNNVQVPAPAPWLVDAVWRPY